MEKDDALRRKLAQTFEDFEVEPNPKAWENIRVALQPERKKRRFILWFWLSMLSLPLGAGFLRMGGLLLERSMTASFVLQTKTAAVAPKLQKSTLPSLQMHGPVAGGPLLQKDNAVIHLKDRLTTQARVQPAVLSDKNAHFTPNTNAVQKQDPTPKSTMIPVMESEEKGIDPLDLIVQSLQAVPLGNNRVAEASISLLLGASLPALSTSLFDDRQPSPIVQRARRRRVFTGSFRVLSSYQRLETQQYQQVAASNIQTESVLSPRRLGTDLSLGAQLYVGKRSDVGFSLHWMNLPYRQHYTLRNLNQVQITIQPDQQYKMEASFAGEVNQTSRLNFVGLQVEYGYTLRFLNKPVRLFAGGQGMLSSSTRNPQAWAVAGLDIPLGTGRFLLSPSFQYQFTQMELSDHLIKAQLYTIGLGLKTKF